MKSCIVYISTMDSETRSFQYLFLDISSTSKKSIEDDMKNPNPEARRGFYRLEHRLGKQQNILLVYISKCTSSQDITHH
jgi:hypothetical protein